MNGVPFGEAAGQGRGSGGLPGLGTIIGTQHSLWRELPVTFGPQPHDLAQPGHELALGAHPPGHVTW